MFVRIKGQIVNLDLIKRISDITPYKMFKSDLKVEDYHWMKIVSGGPNGEIEALNKTANGTENEREFTIALYRSHLLVLRICLLFPSRLHLCAQLPPTLASAH